MGMIMSQTTIQDGLGVQVRAVVRIVGPPCQTGPVGPPLTTAVGEQLGADLHQ